MFRFNGIANAEGIRKGTVPRARLPDPLQLAKATRLSAFRSLPVACGQDGACPSGFRAIAVSKKGSENFAD